MAVSAKHPLYQSREAQWKVIRSAMESEEGVKEKGVEHLPMPSGMAVDPQGSDKYEAYKMRAEFPDLVTPTVTGLTGLITRKDSIYNLPTGLEYLRKTSTLAGHTLVDLHQMIVQELMTTGRAGLLATLSKSDGMPYLALYVGDSIINWELDADDKPTLVVLDETGYYRQGEFDWKKITRHRVLRNAPQYNQQVYEDDAEGDSITPTHLGRTRQDIPFAAAGSVGLGFHPQQVPLIGLGRLAFKIYRQDADYQHSLYLTSQPTPWITGITKENLPSTIGSAQIWGLPNPESEVGYLEVSGNGLEAQERAIENAYKRAVQMGAKLFDITKREAESGDALRLRYSSENATVKTIAKSAAALLELGLQFCADWTGDNRNTVSVVPNLDFIDSLLTADEVLKLVQAKTQGAPLSWETIHDIFRRGELTTRDFKEEQALIEQEPPPAAPPALPAPTDDA